MISENFELKPYLSNLSLADARIKFKIRSEMLDVKFNYKSDKENSADLWRCDSCQTSIETQDHVLWCPAYVDFRLNKNINDDQDLIDYFRKVLAVRDKLKLTK